MPNDGFPCLGARCPSVTHSVTAEPEEAERIIVAFDLAAGPDSVAFHCGHGIPCADGVPLCSECARYFRDVHTAEVRR